MLYEQPELFHGLSPDRIAQILAQGDRITLPSGAQLFSLGTDADRIFIVERGLIRLTLPMQLRGKEEDVLVEDRGPGQTVGWSALIPPYRFTLKATAPVETQIISLSRSMLEQLFASDPSSGYAVSQNVATLVGRRLQLFQAMWLREMQRSVELQYH